MAHLLIPKISKVRNCCDDQLNSPPNSRHRERGRECRFRANSGLMRRSISASFDHLVGAGEQCRRNFHADHFGGFEIYDQFNFCGLLNWQVTRLFPF
jgi:hypothetical protein